MIEFEQWVTRQDGLHNLKLVNASIPKPGPGEVLVKINSVALNYRDIEGMPSQLGEIKSLTKKKRRRTRS